VTAMQCMQFRAKSAKNDFQPTNFQKCNFYYETEGVLNQTTIMYHYHTFEIHKLLMVMHVVRFRTLGLVSSLNIRALKHWLSGYRSLVHHIWLVLRREQMKKTSIHKVKLVGLRLVQRSLTNRDIL
jgi:hypothetical protein